MIEYDEWRQDIINADGVLIAKNVLFIRGRKDNVEFHCPVFEPEWTGTIEATKEFIKQTIERFEIEKLRAPSL